MKHELVANQLKCASGRGNATCKGPVAGWNKLNSKGRKAGVTASRAQKEQVGDETKKRGCSGNFVHKVQFKILYTFYIFT